MGEFGSDTTTVDITAENDAPTITSNGGADLAFSYAENAVTTATTIVASDPDGGTAPTLSLTGADAARFNITQGGVLTFAASPNFEAAIDANGDNAYVVIVNATDAGALVDTQTVTITVTNVNDNTPAITSNGGGASASVSVAENATAVTTVTATDADLTTPTFALNGGADAALFTIDASTGALAFSSARNFEAATDANADGAYVVNVRATDGANTDDQTVSVTVANVNEFAPAITSNGGGATASVSVAENATAVTTVTATDADLTTPTFALNGGADAALFAIDASTGALAFSSARNFEAATDANADGIYVVNVRATDGANTDDQTVSVTVANVNEFAPAITSNGGGATASVSFAESGGTVTTVTATDADGGSTQTYSLNGGADQGLFAINGSTGALTFQSPPDFGAPGDAGGNNVYDVIVQVSDGALTDTQAIAVTVTDSNGAPAFTSSATATVAENAAAVITVVATDDDGAPTYSLNGGADASLFTINSATGALVFANAPNFEAPTDAGANNVYNVIVRASDGVQTTDQALAVTVTGVNEEPVVTSGGTATVAENTTAVMTVTGTDVDAGATQTYSIISGADASRFTINASTGVLSFVSAQNYEAPVDFGGDNVYDLNVRVSDGTLHDNQAVAVTVTNVNEDPIITSGATASVAENATAVMTVTSTDPDPGSTPSYSIFGGADAARFAINASTGALTFQNAPDFETPNDIGANNVYDVIVRVSDGELVDNQTVAVTVTAVNDNAPVVTSAGTASVAENATTVMTVTATDADAGATRSFSIFGGADAALFAINASTGALVFASAPDREAPGDVGGDNVYDVIVRVSDGLLTVNQAVAVTVTGVNDNAPAITSNGAGATASVSFAENATGAITTVTATDADGTTPTYALNGGADASLFAIDASTGALTFLAAKNFEAPGDAGADNVYDVIVRTTDGASTDDQAVAVTLTDVNDNAPAVTSGGTASVAENATTVMTVTATDADAGATRSFSIFGGVDAALFAIDATTGALSFIAGPDFEAPGDVGANNVYNVTVRVSDGLLTADQAVAVTVTGLNDTAPVIGSNGGGATAAVSYAENAVTTVLTVAAADADGTTPTYALNGGADASLFAIDASTGALAFLSPRNFEAPGDAGGDNVYDVIVRATDGANTDDQAVAVTVTDANDGTPVITSAATVNVAENATAVITVTSTDPDAGATRTFSLNGGADAGLFAINASTGALSFLAGQNFEAPGDAGANRVYNVIVRVSDGALTADQPIAVTLTDVNEFAPAINSAISATVVENQTGVMTVTASDADTGTTLTFSLAGGADASLFSVDAATGALSFLAAPNFEAPGDAGANNLYDVVVRASDGTLFDDQAIAVSVTNANDAPVFTSQASASVAENTTTVATVTATDADLGATLSYSLNGGADAGLFAINASTGALSFLSAQNFEAPGDAGANNVYNVNVRVSDGVATVDQAVAVTVTNVSEFPPAITSPVALNVAENTTSVMTVTATDSDGDTTLTYALTDGADMALFAIDSATGALTFISAPNFEDPGDVGENNVYNVVVAASDGALLDTRAVAITVTNANDVPVFTSAATAQVVEGATAVMTVVATDDDPGATLTYSLTGGADQGLFAIDATTGALSFQGARDFETPGDANGDNVYLVTVRASDGVAFQEQTIAVTLGDANEFAPAITSNGGGATASVNFAENAAGAVTTVAASDADGTSPTFALNGGADAGLFAINAGTGALTFIGAPDFEGVGDNVYEVVVRATDGAFSDDQTLTVTVTDAPEAPVISSNGGQNTAAVEFDENATGAVAIVVATDPDITTPTYELHGGADSGLFDINAATGALTFLAAPDFEGMGDNVYEVVVRATDGALSDDQTITVTVANVNEAPEIGSNGAGATASIDFAENGTGAVTTVTASDADGTTPTFALNGGADAGLFAVDATTGALTFIGAPNFEGVGDNVYEVVVRATDGSLSDDQTLAVTVTDVNEAPLIASNGGGDAASVSFAENATTTVATVAASDVDGTTPTYAIVGGSDELLFAIDAATGALTFADAPDFESPDGNVFEVVVEATDGSLSDEQTITVAVTDAVDVFDGDNGDDDFAGTAGIDIMSGYGGADSLTGLAGADTLYGGEGDDTIDGGEGVDDMSGGAGDDTYVVDDVSDGVTELENEGDDTIEAKASYRIAGGQSIETIRLATSTGDADLDLTGNAFANALVGNDGANRLSGGAGADVMVGHGGDDTYVVDNAGDVVTEAADEGDDAILAAVSYALAAGRSIETMTIGGSGKNLTGNELANTLYGNGSANRLNGGAGADVLIGRVGNDTYVVDDLDDVVTEAAGEGEDTIETSATYRLAAGQSVETLRLAAGDADLNLTGNEFANTLVGNGGANRLSGGAGADVMVGHGGDDTYVVDNAGDVVTEAADEGDDAILAAVSYALAAGQSIETMTIGGSGKNLTGNELSNTLVGSSVGNQLDGGAGADVLIGHSGNDTYLVDSADDVVTETAGQGEDTVVSTVAYRIAAGQSVETLRLSPSTVDAGLNLIGNELANTLVGNAGANRLSGGAGADVMIGLAGDDTYVVDNVEDVVIEATDGGSDAIVSIVSYALAVGQSVETMTVGGSGKNLTGNAFANTLIGNGGVNQLEGAGGADVLAGQAGADILIGGTGRDVFRFTSVADSTPPQGDAIRAGGGSVAFEQAGAGLGDLFDFRDVDANAVANGMQDFVFGNATGIGRIWLATSGTDTIVNGNTDADAAAEFRIVIEDGAGVLPLAYTSDDFLF